MNLYEKVLTIEYWLKAKILGSGSLDSTQPLFSCSPVTCCGLRQIIQLLLPSVFPFRNKDYVNSDIKSMIRLNKLINAGWNKA